MKASPNIQSEEEESARERTDWAVKRTLPADERTFSA